MLHISDTAIYEIGVVCFPLAKDYVILQWIVVFIYHHFSYDCKDVPECLNYTMKID